MSIDGTITDGPIPETKSVIEGMLRDLARAASTEKPKAVE